MDVLCVGHASFDVTMSVPHHPSADEKTRATAMRLSGGGPAANAAVQVARLGGRAGFAGYLGQDVFGCAHAAEFEREGVMLDALVRGRAPTPVSQVLAKPDGSRCVINYSKDTPALPGHAIQPDSLHARVMLFDGHEPHVSRRLCAWARGQGIPTVLDAGSLHDGTQALAMEVDYLLGSEKFARQYTGCRDAGLALQALACQRDHVAITLGSRGLVCYGQGRFRWIPAFAVDAVDSTGAGDAFHGAFALAVAEGKGWMDALRFASAAGALACTGLGARHALPRRTEVDRLLAQSDAGG